MFDAGGATHQGVIMTIYALCSVGPVREVSNGHCFSINNRYGGRILTLEYLTANEADEFRELLRNAVAKAARITRP